MEWVRAEDKFSMILRWSPGTGPEKVEKKTEMPILSGF
jgi:hypothetical protein